MDMLRMSSLPKLLGGVYYGKRGRYCATKYYVQYIREDVGTAAARLIGDDISWIGQGSTLHSCRLRGRVLFPNWIPK